MGVAPLFHKADEKRVLRADKQTPQVFQASGSFTGDQRGVLRSHTHEDRTFECLVPAWSTDQEITNFFLMRGRRYFLGGCSSLRERQENKHAEGAAGVTAVRR